MSLPEWNKNMDVFKNVDYLKNKEILKFLYFTKSKVPRLSNFIKTIVPNSDPVFQTQYSRPLMIICETVNICCNDCIICPYSKMTRKKEIMPLELFEKVLHDYSDMGGGKLSLTPKVGDIFFDKFLLERLYLIKKYSKITGLSVTTNTIISDQFNDAELEKIVNSFERLHISIYGIDEEEYTLMTRRNTYLRMVKNIQRILHLSKKPDSIVFGFRFLKPHSPSEINQWILENFHQNIPYGQANIYMDWCGSLDPKKQLPFHAKWMKREKTTSQCIIPLVACQIFSNGDVSFCSCNDYDIKEELVLGNISYRTLTQIFNSSKNKKLWSSSIDLPISCKKCISYRPFSELENNEYVFEKPIDFIGG